MKDRIQNNESVLSNKNYTGLPSKKSNFQSHTTSRQNSKQNINRLQLSQLTDNLLVDGGTKKNESSFQIESQGSVGLF